MVQRLPVVSDGLAWGRIVSSIAGVFRFQYGAQFLMLEGGAGKIKREGIGSDVIAEVIVDLIVDVNPVDTGIKSDQCRVLQWVGGSTA